MGTWSKNKVNPSNLNNGNEYANGDNLSVEALNGIVNSGLYSQDFVEHLADTPDVSEAMNVGTPSVELVNNVVGGKIYKKFKFKNLRYAAANAPVVQSTGQSTTNVMSQKATTDALNDAIEAAQSNQKELLYAGGETFNGTNTLHLLKPLYPYDIVQIVFNDNNVCTVMYNEFRHNEVSNIYAEYISVMSRMIISILSFYFTMPDHNDHQTLAISNMHSVVLEHTMSTGANVAIASSTAPSSTGSVKINAIYRLGRLNDNLYDITFNLTNVRAPYNNNPTVIAKNGTEMFLFSANTNYSLPSTVTVVGATLVSWEPSTGTLTISNPTSNVSITIVGKAISGGQY